MAIEDQPIDTLRDPGTDAGGIELIDLRKEFDEGDVVAVDGIDLEIESGELLVLLGPSGCGKTTTLRLIAGLEIPTAGTIRIEGEDVTRELPQDRELSMVFQSYALYPHKTVYENLEFPLNKMDLTAEEKRRKIEQAAELLEIDELLDRKPKQLSGGQRQRVAVGRTIVREPRVFLMDEPLSNLDAKLRVKARSEIRELQKQLGTTTVYVTHDQEEAMSIGDRIAIMDGGEIVQVGTPEEIYTNPANEFVAGFIGEPAMNFLDVEPVDGELTAFGDGDRVGLGIDRGREVRRIGVRPEDVHLVDPSVDTSDAGTLGEPIEFEVAIKEPLGHAYELSLERDGRLIKAWARYCPETVREGSTVRVTFDLDRIHAFDADGEVVDA